MSILTTVLEVVGMVLVAAALGLFVAQWTIPGGVGLFGALLVGVSALIERRRRQ